jgi:hypothetical protein
MGVDKLDIGSAPVSKRQAKLNNCSSADFEKREHATLTGSHF